MGQELMLPKPSMGARNNPANDSLIQDQMENRARFILMDPSLRDIRGHHYELATNITHGAIAAGYDVLWLVHREFPKSAHPDDVVVQGVFSRTMYDGFIVTTKSNVPSYRWFPSASRKVQWWYGALRQKAELLKVRIFGPGFLDSDAQLKNGKGTIDDELLSILKQERVSSKDHLLIHTADGATYSTILNLILKQGVGSLPYIHLCTPYDSTTMPHQDGARSVSKVINYINELGAMNYKLFLYGENDLLSVELEKWLGFRVDALNLPAPRMATEVMAPRASNDSLTVVCLGAAREEKGFLLLPDLVAALYESHGKSGRIRFIIQCSPQIVGYKPSIVEAINRLRQFPTPYVELRSSVQATETYYTMLQDADVVMTCYDAKKYKCRGSGVAVEAVSMGKILLATSDTFPAYLAGDGGATGSNLEEYIAALNDIVHDPDKYRQAAIRNGRRYRERNSAKNYITRLLDRAGKVKLMNSNNGGLRPIAGQTNIGTITDLVTCRGGDYEQILKYYSRRLPPRLVSGSTQLLSNVIPIAESDVFSDRQVEYGFYLDKLVQTVEDVEGTCTNG